MTEGSNPIGSRMRTWRAGAAFVLSFTLTLGSFAAAQATDAAKSQTQMIRAQALQNIASGRDSEAIESYKSAIKAAKIQYGQESTYLSDLYFEMGNLARNKGQSELAQSCYRNAVRYRPNDVPARVQLAELERSTKNVPGAFEDAKIAYAKNPALSISRKELMMCMQLSGRPALAARIGATLSRTSKNVPAIPKNVATQSMPLQATSAPAEEGAAGSGSSSSGNPNGPVITSVPSMNSALHWQRKKTDDAAAKKAAEETKRKADEAAKKEKQAQEQKLQEQKKRDDAEKRAKQQKQKKDESKKASKAKTAAPATSAPVDTIAPTASLKTSATTLPKSDEKSKADKAEKSDKTDKAERADKSEKPEKSTSKTHASVSAVTEKTDKPAVEKHESSLSENEPAKPNAPAPEKAHPVGPVAMPTAPVMIPIDPGKKGKPHLGKTGLVPPPPATPLFFAPPPMQPAPPPAAVAPKPKAKPVKPAVKETKEASDDSAASKPAAADDSGDPDFLIHWGDANKKKHAK